MNIILSKSFKVLKGFKADSPMDGVKEGDTLKFSMPLITSWGYKSDVIVYLNGKLIYSTTPNRLSNTLNSPTKTPRCNYMEEVI